MSQTERRVGTAKMAEDIGYIRGQLDTIVPSIKENTDKIAHVEKKVDRYRNIVAGAGTAIVSIWTSIIQWEKIKHFFVGTSS